MPSFYVVEFGITAVVVITQIAAFVATWRTALRLGRLFPASPEASIEPIALAPEESSGAPRRGALRLHVTGSEELETAELLAATNEALAIDDVDDEPFEVIRTTARTRSDRLERQALATSNVPVFIGLMGTFAGIIAGLLQMTFESGFKESTIQLFLGGVLVAMFGSLMGVFLMVLGSAMVIPKYRRLRDVRLDAYLVAARRALAQAHVTVDRRDSPRLAATSLEALGAFNAHFSLHVRRFQETVRDLSGSIERQQSLIDAFGRLNVDQMIQHNARMIERTQPLLGALAAASESLKGFTATTDQAEAVANRINLLMDRVGRFETSINSLGEKIATDQTLTAGTVELIRDQIEAIGNRRAMISQFVELQDDRVKTFATEQAQHITDLMARGAQNIDRIGEQVAGEVARVAEPARVRSFMEHVAVLPSLLDTAGRALTQDESEAQRTATYRDETLRELRALGDRIERLGHRPPWWMFWRRDARSPETGESEVLRAGD